LIPILLIIVLFILLIRTIFGSGKDFYKIESRLDKVSANQKKDEADYKTIGWVKLQGTNIDLPILRQVNESFDYPAEVENYAWTLNKDEKFYNVMNIFGHNIFNLSSSPKKSSKDFKRFEELMGYVYPEVAEDGKYIQLTIDGKEYLYKIFVVSFIDAVDVEMFPIGEYNKQEVSYVIKLLKENSIYDYDIDVNSSDKILMLNTCTRFFGTDRYIDFFVTGRLVRDDEKINDYSLKKNENYKKVENVLKGDDSNEKINEA